MNFFKKETMPNNERPPMKNFLKHVLPVLAENNIKDLNPELIAPLRETINFPPMKENPLLNILLKARISLYFLKKLLIHRMNKETKKIIQYGLLEILGGICLNLGNLDYLLLISMYVFELF